MPPAMDGQLIKPPARLRFVRPCTGALSGVAPETRRKRRKHRRVADLHDHHHGVLVDSAALPDPGIAAPHLKLDDGLAESPAARRSPLHREGEPGTAAVGEHDHVALDAHRTGVALQRLECLRPGLGAGPLLLGSPARLVVEVHVEHLGPALARVGEELDPLQPRRDAVGPRRHRDLHLSVVEGVGPRRDEPVALGLWDELVEEALALARGLLQHRCLLCDDPS